MKKFKKVLLLLVVLFSLTGCTKYMQYDSEKKDVVAPETGQRMVENIYVRLQKQKKHLRQLKMKKLKNIKHSWTKIVLLKKNLMKRF